MKKWFMLGLFMLVSLMTACGDSTDDTKRNGTNQNGGVPIDQPNEEDETNGSLYPELARVFDTLKEENFTLSFLMHLGAEHSWDVHAKIAGEIIFVEDEFYGVRKEQYVLIEQGNTVSYTRFNADHPWVRDVYASKPEFIPRTSVDLEDSWFMLEDGTYRLRSEHFRNFERFIMIDDVVSATLTLQNNVLQFDISSVLDLHGAQTSVETVLSFKDIGATVITLPSFSHYIDDDED